jgi:hypothetical protein
MGDKNLGALYHAGILEPNETLTQRAKDLFIEDVKKELLLGSDGYTPVFPCGPSIKPNPFADQLNLEDEKSYPEFHKNVLKGQYEKIAEALNLKGGFTVLPICDPFAIAVNLGIDLDIDISFPDGFLDYLIPNLPKLAIDLDIMPPPKLALKFPSLLTIPPSIPNFNIPPLPNPQLDFVPGLNVDLKFALLLKDLILKLTLQIPNLIIDIPNLPSAVCNIVFDAGLYNTVPDAIVRLVSYKVLIRKISEMLMIVAVGKVVGSAPQGITGGLGRKLGYEPPTVQKKKKPRDVRQKILTYAASCIDLELGNRSPKSTGGTIQENYLQRLLYTEYGDGTRKDNLPADNPTKDKRVIGKQLTLEKASNASSCGMLVRACYFAAGAKYVFKYQGQPLLNKNEKIGRYYDFFSDEYRILNGSGIAIEGLLQAAKAKDAIIPKTKNDLPAIKRGDSIIVYDPKHAGREHVILVTSDYEPGSFSLETVEGGQPDPTNSNRPTAIRKKTYKNPSDSEFTNKQKKTDPPYGFTVDSSGVVRLSGREILAIIDGEKLCTNKTGSSTSSPNKSIEFDIYDRNDPTSDEAAGFLPPEG